MKQERTWRLIARKLSNEITETERAELEVLLTNNQQLANCYEMMAHVWKAGSEEMHIDDQLTMRLLRRAKKCMDDIY